MGRFKSSNFRSVTGCLVVGLAVPCAAATGTPELRLIVEGTAQGTCFEPQELIEVRVHVGPADVVINGGQFVVEYDTGCVELVAIAPAIGPYAQPLASIVDEQRGWLFYAGGIEFGGIGARGEADLALLTFAKTGACTDCILCFGGENPFNTYLTDDEGQPVLVSPQCSEPIRHAAGLELVVPGSAEAEVGCHEATATVRWDPPLAEAACGDVALLCSGEHESGAVFDGQTVLHGGKMPRGVSTFCCIAEGDCAASAQACWTVTVRDPHSFLHTQPDPSGVGKNRFISFQVDTEGRPAAIRVTMVKLYDEADCPARGSSDSDLSLFNGSVRWVGPPFTASETKGDEPPLFMAAGLQCCPYVADWSSVLAGELLHVFGPEVVPCSSYLVEVVPDCCVDSAGASECLGAGRTVSTAVWGDVAEPLADGRQPNFSDITAAVDKFKNVPFNPGPPPSGGLSKTRTMLRANLLDIHSQINFNDIALSVNAFRLAPYGEAGPEACVDPCP